jgi:hypothetical protein
MSLLEGITRTNRPLSHPSSDPERGSPRAWPGAVMLLASLVLVGLAGCFLVGVLALLRPELLLAGAAGPRLAALSAEDQMLLVTLYVFAFSSLLGALVLFVLGLRCLVRTTRG